MAAPSPRRARPSGGGNTALAARPVLASANPMPAPRRRRRRPLVQLASLEDVVALASQNRDITLKLALERDVRPVRFEPGRIEFSLTPGAPRHLATDLSRKLQGLDRPDLDGRRRHRRGRRDAARAGRGAEGPARERCRLPPGRQGRAGALSRRAHRRCARSRGGRGRDAAWRADPDDAYLPDGEPLFDDSEPDFDGIDF